MEILYYFLAVLFLLSVCFYISNSFNDLAIDIHKGYKLTKQEKKGMSFLKSNKSKYLFLAINLIFILLSIFVFEFWQEQLFYSICLILLTANFFMDMSVKLLPDVFTLSLLWVGLIASALGISGISSSEAIISAFSVYVSFVIVLTVIESFMKKEVFGGGDIKIIAAFAAIFGGITSIIIMFLASFVMLILMLLFSVAKISRDKEIPFGIGLTFVAMVNIFCPNIINYIIDCLVL